MLSDESDDQPAPTPVTIWDSAAWLVLERIINLIIILALVFGLWNTVIHNNAKQVERDKKRDATLEAIKQGMKPKSWQSVEPHLRKNK